YISIYGMPPREWYRRGIRLLARTGIESTRDALADRIALDVASLAARLDSANGLRAIDTFAGSSNSLFWILRHLQRPYSNAFESFPQIYELTRRNFAALGQNIELVQGDYAWLLEERRISADRVIAFFIAPPWGAALDEVQGLDLCGTIPPITEVIDEIAR